MHPSLSPQLTVQSPHPTCLYNFDNGYDYVSEPNENLMCPICRNPFLEPVMCESTDHIFCQSCLIKSLEVSATCPIDRLPLSLSLIVPAPKMINKLVDELLVYCPYKTKLDCSFVCQRDLIHTHLRSHQVQLDEQELNSSLQSSKDQSVSSVDKSLVKSTLLDHPSTNSSRLRFQWLDNYATLAIDPSDQTQIISASDFTTNTTQLSHCPFERFGCSFVGTPEVITQQHLSVDSDSSSASDQAPCRFASVQEILHWFEHLEARNIELKQQLSQSLIQQGKLTTVLEKLKASFRQLWRSQQPGEFDSHLASAAPCSPSGGLSPVGPSHSGPGNGRRTSVLSRLQIPGSCATDTASVGPLGDTNTSLHSSDDPHLMSCSRMSYAVNGARLRRCDDHPGTADCAGRCPQFYSPIGSPSHLKIRVKTFLRRGETLTPTVEDSAHLLPAVGVPHHLLPRPLAPAGPSCLPASNPSPSDRSWFTPVSDTPLDAQHPSCC
ncbi:hypothetical protein PCANC_09518 [Puccinia coronata f. sp. avenae]|uniref:RING-type domain-containing protein n=1 Tax=Puccinia coronata f. sp. avenae TaxID=200324 RepID=A0A2N5TPU7_9BASI|nr:hypothetical protein PCASD_17661 [Puccinia coronata f. sp. avenae]PLW45085.1 hypothetical protein PCANC_09518 [Puccinia coronata f. sp. avenae]